MRSGADRSKRGWGGGECKPKTKQKQTNPKTKCGLSPGTRRQIPLEKKKNEKKKNDFGGLPDQ